MELTIDLDTVRIFVSIKKYARYAVVIIKFTGHAYRMSIPDLIATLESVAKEKKNAGL